MRILRRIAGGGALVALAALGGCVARGGEAEPRVLFTRTERQLAPDVRVERVAPGLWVHTTVADLPDAGPVPANGVLLETGDGSVLFDTGWNDRQTELLLRWAAGELGRPVRRTVVTHWHEDRMGGIGALRRAGVPAVALGLTARLAAEHRLPAPDSLPGLAGKPHRDPAGYELLHPGPGHTPDNVVAYFPRQRVLFGGCLVKADTATTVGNVADADVSRWPRTVARVRAAYPEVRIVVPGHGAVGGPAALRATEALIESKGPAAVEALRRRSGTR